MDMLHGSRLYPCNPIGYMLNMYSLYKQCQETLREPGCELDKNKATTKDSQICRVRQESCMPLCLFSWWVHSLQSRVDPLVRAVGITLSTQPETCPGQLVHRTCQAAWGFPREWLGDAARQRRVCSSTQGQEHCRRLSLSTLCNWCPFEGPWICSTLGCQWTSLACQP